MALFTLDNVIGTGTLVKATKAGTTESVTGRIKNVIIGVSPECKLSFIGYNVEYGDYCEWYDEDEVEAIRGE